MWTASVHILSPFGDGLALSTLDGSVIMDDQGRPSLRLRVRLDHTTAASMPATLEGSGAAHLAPAWSLQTLPERFHGSIGRLLKRPRSKRDRSRSHHLELRATLASAHGEHAAPRFVLYAVTVFSSEIYPMLGDVSDLATHYLTAFVRLFWLQGESSVGGIRASTPPAGSATGRGGVRHPR